MENELNNTTPTSANSTLKLEGKHAADAVGYVVLGLAAICIVAMLKNYSLSFGKLTLSPAT